MTTHTKRKKKKKIPLVVGSLAFNSMPTLKGRVMDLVQSHKGRLVF